MDEERERTEEDVIADIAAERLLWLRKRMRLTEPVRATDDKYCPVILTPGSKAIIYRIIRATREL